MRLTRTWHYRSVNDAFAAEQGHTLGVIEGRSIWEVYPDFAPTAQARLLRRAMRTRRPASGRFPSPYPGRDVILTVEPLPDGGLEVAWSYCEAAGSLGQRQQENRTA